MRSAARFALTLGAITGLAAGAFVSGQTSAGQPASLAQTAGAISGVVVDSVTGQPLAGAVVLLGNVGRRGGGPSARQLTDRLGRFVFTGLDTRAAHAFGAKKAGYFDATDDDVSHRDIRLGAGEWFRDLRIAMRRPGSISGAVRDEAGEPVVGAFVQLLADVFVAGVRHAVSGPTARTDDRGVYRFGGLQPGQYTIMVPSVQHAVPAEVGLIELSGLTATVVAFQTVMGRGPSYRDDPIVPMDPATRLVVGEFATPPPTTGGRPQAYPITYYPGARTRDAAARVAVDVGLDLGGIDIGLAPVPTATVSGRVDGPVEAIASLTLRLMPPDAASLMPGNEAATTLVRQDGTFTFLSVPAGDYAIVATRSVTGYMLTSSITPDAGEVPDAPGVRFVSMSSASATSAPRGTAMRSQSSAGDTSHFGRLPITVGDADVSGIVVPMTRGSAIRGRVVLLDENATPRPPRSVSAEPANGDPALGLILGRLDLPESGAFAIEGLRSGAYLLNLFGGGTWLVRSIQWQGREWRDAAFDTTAGQQYDGVVVTATLQAATIGGTVRNAQGFAAAGAGVIVFPADPSGWREYGLQPDRLRAVTANADGRFQITRMPAGEYRLIAVERAMTDAWKDPAFLERAAGQSTRLTIDWGQSAQQDLTMRTVGGQ